MADNAPDHDDSLAIDGASCRESWLEVEEGVSLRVIEWTPDDPVEPHTVLFVAGWVSVVEGWRPLLEAMARRQRVVYVESREKRSARIHPRALRPSSFAIPRLAEDLVVVGQVMALDPAETVLFGSSMGANAILEALKGGRLAARAAFLIGPNAEFVFPWWGKLLTYMPAGIYHPVRPLLESYLGRRRVNTAADPAQMERYRRTMRAAHPLRLKLSARAILGYRIWHDLERVDVPVALAYAASDTLHGGEDIERIVDALPRGQAVECPTNTYMHGACVLDELDRFVQAC